MTRDAAFGPKTCEGAGCCECKPVDVLLSFWTGLQTYPGLSLARSALRLGSSRLQVTSGRSEGDGRSGTARVGIANRPSTGIWGEDGLIIRDLSLLTCRT